MSESMGHESVEITLRNYGRRGTGEAGGEVSGDAETLARDMFAGWGEGVAWEASNEYWRDEFRKRAGVVLRSRWLAAHVAAERDRADAEAGAKALEDYADTIQPGDHDCFKPWCPECSVRKTNEFRQHSLRARADALRAAQTAEPEGAA